MRRRSLARAASVPGSQPVTARGDEDARDPPAGVMAQGDDGVYVSDAVCLRDAALFTDLYELTMAAVYHRRSMHGAATFSLFARKLPARRSFLVAAGLEDALRFLEQLRFSALSIEYLRSLDRFDESLLEHLRELRFTGSVRAVPEGTVVFPDEPLLEVTAPILEAQLVETAILNAVHLETVLASKAARVVMAAGDRVVVDFGLRRTHGIDAGMKAARAAYVAGATASSNVLAGMHYGIEPSGTMAHSFVCSFPSEIEAFRAFVEAFPRGATLLVDSYDTITGTRRAIEVAHELEGRGARLGAVRLDSGDLGALAREVRRMLDEAGLPYVRIVASGGLDEEDVSRLVEGGAPIDAFGVGTRMTTSSDAPYLDMAYKLVRYDGRDVLKLSPGKRTWVGEKQVWRTELDGSFAGDLIATSDEPAPAAGATPLLRQVMVGGARTTLSPSLTDVRAWCAAQLAALPVDVRQLHDAIPYPVTYSTALQARQRSMEEEVARREC